MISVRYVHSGVFNKDFTDKMPDDSVTIFSNDLIVSKTNLRPKKINCLVQVSGPKKIGRICNLFFYFCIIFK